MGRIGKWKRSQTSSGYYAKTSGNLPVFLKMRESEFGEGNYVWDVIRINGLQGHPAYIGRESSHSKAKKWMIQYMRSHPYGW